MMHAPSEAQIIAEIRAIESEIDRLRRRWARAERSGRRTEFLTLAIHRALGRRSGLEAKVPEYTARKYRARAIATVESLDR